MMRDDYIMMRVFKQTLLSILHISRFT